MLTCDMECEIIDGDCFFRLLDLCFQKSEFFSFTVHGIPDTDNTLQNELSRYAYATIKTTKWFNYYTLPENPITIIIYHANCEALAILRKYCHRLFLFDDKCSPSSWNQNLEDLCLFSNGKLLLGTVSHEHMCEVFPPDNSVKCELLDIYAHWKESQDSTEQYKLCDFIFGKKSTET